MPEFVVVVEITLGNLLDPVERRERSQFCRTDEGLPTARPFASLPSRCLADTPSPRPIMKAPTYKCLLSSTLPSLLSNPARHSSLVWGALVGRVETPSARVR